MTVAEIQEYIDKQIADIKKDKYIYNDRGDTVGEIKGFRETENALYEIKSMLDELEPEAKWKHDGSQWENRFICSKCGHKIFEEQQPYCSNCGARMNDEVDNGSAN